MPFDADEFLLHLDGRAIRATLEDLDDDELYQVRCLNFLPPKSAIGNDTFYPESCEEFTEHISYCKLIVSAKYLAQTAVQLTTRKFSAEKKVVDNLMLAHYPIRSVPQALARTIVGSPECTGQFDPNENAHINMMHNRIKDNQQISYEQLCTFAKFYAFADINDAYGDVKTIPFQMKTYIRLRYTDYHESQKKFMEMLPN